LVFIPVEKLRATRPPTPIVISEHAPQDSAFCWGRKAGQLKLHPKCIEWRKNVINAVDVERPERSKVLGDISDLEHFGLALIERVNEGERQANAVSEVLSLPKFIEEHFIAWIHATPSSFIRSMKPSSSMRSNRCFLPSLIL